MSLQDTPPITLNDIYQEAVANGYMGNSILSELLVWNGWTNLPVGANSVLDFLSADTGAEIVPLSAFEFDPLSALYISAFLIDPLHVMNFWLTNNVGNCQIFEINTETGDITPMGAPVQFSPFNSSFSSAFLINNTRVMNFWVGDGDSCQIFEIDTITGTVTPLGAAFEFDVTYVRWNSAFLIDPTHVMNFWENDSGNNNRNGRCQIFEINAVTGAISSLGMALEFDTSAGALNSSFLVDPTHVMNFWSGGISLTGFCQIFEIDTGTGTITPMGTALEFDASDTIYDRSAFLIDATHVINFWLRGDTIGFCQIFEINTTTGTITPMGSPFQFDDNYPPGYGGLIKAFLIDATHVMSFWSTDDEGFCQIFEINTTTGTITPSGNPMAYDNFSLYNSSFLIDSSHVMNFWRGGSNEFEGDGYCRVFEIQY